MKKDFDVTRFRKLVALFDSDRQGEADNAFHMAAKMCAAHGMRFPEMLAESFGETRVVYETLPRRTWRERFASRLKKLMHELAVIALAYALLMLGRTVVLTALRVCFGWEMRWMGIAVTLGVALCGLPGDWAWNLCETIVDAVFARWF